MNDSPDQDTTRIDDYLDGLLTESEEQQFLQQLSNPQELAELKQLQQQIDSSLKSENQFQLSAESATQIEKRFEESLALKAVLASRRLFFNLSAAAAVLLGIAGGAIWFSGNNSNSGSTNQSTETTFAQIYRKAVADGFSPTYGYEDPEQFEKVFKKRQPLGLKLAELPAGTQLAGISYLGGATRNTTALLGTSNGTQVIVFVDLLMNDDPKFTEQTGDLNLFRTVKNTFVFYEISPLETKCLTQLFEPSKHKYKSDGARIRVEDFF